MTDADLQVRLTPKDITFGVSPGETILRAAERQGVVLKYGCRHGNCSSCKYELVEGDVDFGIASPYSLSEAEREDGWALLCCAFPLEDLVIQDDDRPDPRARPLLTPSEHDGVVEAAEKVGPGVWRLTVELSEKMEFYPGQFAEIAVPGAEGQWRSYSMASAPSESGKLEFLIKSVEGGAFSGQVGTLAPGAPLRLRGPLGDAYLRSGNDPVVLVGIGTGLAPLLSMLRDAADAGDDRPFTLFYGAREVEGLVAWDEVQELTGRLSLTVIGCLTGLPEDHAWEGFEGRVTHAVQGTLSNVGVLDAYLCGLPEMCTDVQRLLEAKGADEHRIFSDPFYSAVS